MVNLPDIRDGHAVAPAHDGEVPQACEEGLHLMRNADTEGIVDRFGYALLHAQVVAHGQAPEAIDAGLSVPWTDANGIQIVDPVGDSQPLNEWPKADAARDDQAQGPVTHSLQRTAQPAEKFIDSALASRFAKHSLEEDRQLVQDEHDRPIVRCTFPEQCLSEGPPASLIESCANLHPELVRTDLLDAFAEPTPHSSREPSRD